MKRKSSLAILFVCVLLVLAVAVGCSKAPNDAQLIGEVTQKIQADPNMQTKAVSVQSNNGVVTLSGTVSSDAERVAAANDAAQVAGVKTVVNNLTVQQAEATPAPVEQPQVEEPKPEPVKASARHREVPRETSRSRSKDQYSAPRDTVSQAAPATQPAPAPVQQAMTPPPPPKPTTLTIPDGTTISIRLIDPLDSEKNQIGDSFRATLNHSISVGDHVAIPQGADVMGRVIDVKGAGHFTGKSVLAVELVSLAMGGKTYELHTNEYRKEGAARGKNTAEKVGAGAAIGAIIGGLAGGGKGAAIGATVGAGAGGGVQAATHGQQIKLPSESVLNFQLLSPLTVTPGKVRGQPSNGPTLTDRTSSESE
jgi:hypothetical protein